MAKLQGKMKVFKITTAERKDHFVTNSSNAEKPDGNTYHVTTKKETAKASDERAKRNFLIPWGNLDTVAGSTSQEVL